MKNPPVIVDRVTIGGVNAYLIVDPEAGWFVAQGTGLRDYDALTIVTNYEGAAVRRFNSEADAFVAFERIRDRKD